MLCWQTTSDFNEILHQHCEVKLQTRHQISAKSVNIYNSYSATSAGRCHAAALHMILQLPPNLVVDWVKVRTVGWPQSWSDEFRCFMS